MPLLRISKSINSLNRLFTMLCYVLQIFAILFYWTISDIRSRPFVLTAHKHCGLFYPPAKSASKPGWLGDNCLSFTCQWFIRCSPPATQESKEKDVNVIPRTRIRMDLSYIDPQKGVINYVSKYLKQLSTWMCKRDDKNFATNGEPAHEGARDWNSWISTLYWDFCCILKRPKQKHKARRCGLRIEKFLSNPIEEPRRGIRIGTRTL